MEGDEPASPSLLDTHVVLIWSNFGAILRRWLHMLAVLPAAEALKPARAHLLKQNADVQL